MHHLKKKIKNLSKVEGSIVEQVNEETLMKTTFHLRCTQKTEDLLGMMMEGKGQRIMFTSETSSRKLDDLVENPQKEDLLRRSTLICKHICSPTVKMFYSMRT